MAFVQLADGELHYQLQGPQLDGPVDAPVLVLSNSLGTDLHMWDAQIPAFTEHFRVLRFDTRGHGKSLVTPGPYSIEQLGRDVLALLDALHIERAHFCGLSMGGLIGQWLGINAGERLNKLVVCNTAAKIGDPSVWNPRIETVLRDGQAAMVALRDASIARWFTPDFSAANPAAAKQITDMLAATSPEGYAANCAAVGSPLMTTRLLRAHSRSRVERFDHALMLRGSKPAISAIPVCGSTGLNSKPRSACSSRRSVAW